MKKLVFSVALLACLLLPASALTFGTNLTVGTRNANVKIMQQFLIDKGYLTGEATGYFGQQTKLAIQKFQKENSLPATGNWFALTREKAESYAQKISTSSFYLPSTSSSSKVPETVNVSNKKHELGILVGYGGTVSSKENGIACYSFENCTYSLLEGKTITLQVVANSGYEFKGWSEASCGNQSSCTFKLTQPMKVYAYFEVPKPKKGRGEIVSPNYPSETCYIKLGRDSCDFRFTYRADVDVNVKLNEEEYMIVTKSNSNFYYEGSVDPQDIAKAVSEKVSGLLYFTLWPHNKYTIQLLSRDNKIVLDKINIDIKCAPGLEWSGSKCWEKGANMLHIFKRNSFIFTTEPAGILCGGEPEVCTAGFSNGQSVTIKATTTTGYSFSGWTGDCSGNEPTCTLIMDKNKSVGVK